MISEEQIDRILKRLAELEATMAEGGSSDDFVRLSKEYAELSPVARTAAAVLGMRLMARPTLPAMVRRRPRSPL